MMRVSEPCFLLSLVLLLGLTIADQEEAVQVLHLHKLKPFPLHFIFHHPSPLYIGVSVNGADIPAVSSSILAAESWLRTHVLAHFPSTNITVITVGRGILCNRDYEQRWRLILPSLKNMYHSLTRWGLQEVIKVSVVFPSDCFFFRRFGGDKFQNTLKTLLGFVEENSLPYIVDPPPHISHSLLYFVHRAALKRSGLSGIRNIMVIRAAKPISRKLYSFSSTTYPEKPKGLGLITPTASASDFAPVPGSSFSFAPDSLPYEIPTNPPEASVVPPPACFPVSAPAPGETAPERKGGLWCVAKPTVPDEKLQEAVNYACGEGGADCEEIKPNGKCYYPDNVVAHASYAFNSYWQKTKQTGGSCSFDGTAILINSDPSFLQCKFLQG